MAKIRVTTEWESWEPASDRASRFSPSLTSRTSMPALQSRSGYVETLPGVDCLRRHLREVFAHHLTLADSGSTGTPLVPVPFISRVSQFGPRPMRFIAASYDLTFPLDLTQERLRKRSATICRLDVVWLRVALHDGLAALERPSMLEDCHVYAIAFES